MDIDGDDDLDIVSGTYNTSTLSWYENDGSQNFTKNLIGNGNVNSPSAVDLDEDGDIDLICRFNDGANKLVWFENDEIGVF